MQAAECWEFENEERYEVDSEDDEWYELQLEDGNGKQSFVCVVGKATFVWSPTSVSGSLEYILLGGPWTGSGRWTSSGGGSKSLGADLETRAIPDKLAFIVTT